MKRWRVRPVLLVVLLVTYQDCVCQNGHRSVDYLLYYTCCTKEVANQCEECFSPDQQGFANTGFTNNLTLAQEGAKKNISTLFAVHDIFFDNGNGMREDWVQRWLETQTLLDPLIDSGVVIGFFMGDELFPGKVSIANFTSALEAVKQYKMNYPHLFTWENQGGTKWLDMFNSTYKLPEDLDVISIDDYQLTIEELKEVYEKKLYPIMHDHQNAWLVPGAYGSMVDPKHNLSYYDTQMAEKAWEFFAWANADDTITGLAPWHWDTRGPTQVSKFKEVGIVDMPKLKVAYCEIMSLIHGSDTGCNPAAKYQEKMLRRKTAESEKVYPV